ncbi:MAG: hypothetical protein ACJA1X_002025 [Bermanella sp.]|jgi:hypothetical protein
MVCRIYENYGKVKGSLSDWQFSDLIWVEGNFDSVLPKGDPSIKGQALSKIYSELEHCGYIREGNENNKYMLTEKGFMFGTESYWKKQLNYINKNSGLAVVVSFFALVVSIVALYFSMLKP